VKSLKILRIDGGTREWVEDLVTEEVPLRLLVGPRRLATLLCSPAELEDLVRGFFYTAGFIERGEDIRKLVVNRATWSAFVELAPHIDPDRLRLPGVIGTGCGAVLSEDGAGGESGDTAGGANRRTEGQAHGQTAGGRALGEPGKVLADGPSEPPPADWMTPERISAFMHEALQVSEVHRRTGGVHMAALADASGLLFLREDIGRHNAVDKVVGANLAASGSFGDKVLLASGRLSSELLAKALRCGVPVLVSRSAPTDRSIALARERGLTLIGFARGRRMNVYSAPKRLSGWNLEEQRAD
jgi:FdhD protein